MSWLDIENIHTGRIEKVKTQNDDVGFCDHPDHELEITGNFFGRCRRCREIFDVEDFNTDGLGNLQLGREYREREERRRQCLKSAEE